MLQTSSSCSEGSVGSRSQPGTMSRWSCGSGHDLRATREPGVLCNQWGVITHCFPYTGGREPWRDNEMQLMEKKSQLTVTSKWSLCSPPGRPWRPFQGQEQIHGLGCKVTRPSRAGRSKNEITGRSGIQVLLSSNLRLCQAGASNSLPEGRTLG